MWKDLTLSQKAEIMKMSVAAGVTDINNIQQLYDDSIEHEFKAGGSKDTYIDPSLSIYAALKKAGIEFNTSNPSGYRGSGHYVGKAREKSQHAQKRKDGTAWALDITGDFNKIRKQIAASKPLQDYFKANGISVSEEITKEALARTGGTGPHFHIGRRAGHNHFNPTLDAYNRIYGSPKLSSPADMFYHPMQEMKWQNITPQISPQIQPTTVFNPELLFEQIVPTNIVSIEKRVPIKSTFPSIPQYLFNTLQDQQTSVKENALPTYNYMPIDMNAPYILFGR